MITAQGLKLKAQRKNQIFQDLLGFFLFGRFQLVHLVEVVELQRGPDPLQQIGPDNRPLGVPEVLAELDAGQINGAGHRAQGTRDREITGQN